MDKMSPYEEAHLISAAVRVLEFREKRSPSFEEIGGVLGMNTERVSVICGRLKNAGIIDFINMPFEKTGIAIKNFPLIEGLEKNVSKNSFADDIKKFQEKSKNGLEDKVRAFTEEKKKKEQKLFEELQNKFKSEINKTS